MLIFLTALSTMSFMERLPGNFRSTPFVFQQRIHKANRWRATEVFMRIWIEIAPTNNNYFAGYAVIACAGFLVSIVATWYGNVHQTF